MKILELSTIPQIMKTCVTLMREMKPEILGKYLLEAWTEREMVTDPPLGSQEQQ